jgi:hypothetical protein
VSDSHEVNPHPRQVAADKDELIRSQERLLAMMRERSQMQETLLKGQDEMLQLQAERIEAQAELIRRLQDEVAELTRQADTSSSMPPSADSVSGQDERQDRKPGDQPGRTDAV